MRMRTQSQKEHFNRPPDNPLHGSPSESSGSPHSSISAHKVNSNHTSSDSNSCSNSNKSEEVSESSKTNQFHSFDSSENGLHYLNQQSSQNHSGLLAENEAYFCPRQTPYWKKPHSSNYKHPYWRNFDCRSSKSDDEFEGKKPEKDITISGNPELQQERDKQSKTTCGRKYSPLKSVDHLNPKFPNKNKSRTTKRKKSLWVAFQKRLRRTFERKYAYYLDPSYQSEILFGDSETSENKSSDNASKQVKTTPVEMENITYDQFYLYPSYKKVYKYMPRKMLKKLVEGKNKMMSFSNSEKTKGEAMKSGDSNASNKPVGPSIFDEKMSTKSLAIKRGDFLPLDNRSLNMSDDNDTNLLKTTADCQDSMSTEDIRCATSENPPSNNKFKHLSTKVDKTEELRWNENSDSNKPSSNSENENLNYNNKQTKPRNSCLKCKEGELKNYLIGRWKEILGAAEPDSVKSHDTRKSSLDMDTLENVSKSSKVEIQHIGVSKLNYEKHMPIKYPNSNYSSETKNNDCAHHLPFSSQEPSTSIISKEPEEVDSCYSKKDSANTTERGDIEQPTQANTHAQPEWFFLTKPPKIKRFKKFCKSLNTSVNKRSPPSIGKNSKLQESSMKPSRTNLNRFNDGNKEYLYSRSLEDSKLMKMNSCFVKVCRIDNTLLKQYGVLYEPKIILKSKNVYDSKHTDSSSKSEENSNEHNNNNNDFVPISIKDSFPKPVEGKVPEPTEKSSPKNIEESLPETLMQELFFELTNCIEYQNTDKILTQSSDTMTDEALNSILEGSTSPMPSPPRVKFTKDDKSKKLKRKRCSKHTKKLKMWEEPTQPQANDSTKLQMSNNDSDRSTPSIIVSIPKQKIEELLPQLSIKEPFRELIDCVVYKNSKQFPTMPTELINKESLKDLLEENISPILPPQKKKRVKSTEEVHSKKVKRKRLDKYTSNLKISDVPNKPQKYESTQSQISNADFSQRLIELPELERTKLLDDDYSTPSITVSIPIQIIEELLPQQSTNEPFSKPTRCVVDQNSKQFPAQSQIPNETKLNKSTQTTIFKNDISQKLIQPPEFERTDSINVNHSTFPIIESILKQYVEGLLPRQSMKEPFSEPTNCVVFKNTQQFPVHSTGSIPKDALGENVPSMLPPSKAAKIKYSKDKKLKKLKLKRYVTCANKWEINDVPTKSQTNESTQPPISNSDFAQNLIEPQQLESIKLINDGCFRTPMIETKISEKPTQPQTTESTHLPMSNSDIAQKLIEPPQLERTERINDGCFKTPMVEAKISEKPTQPQTTESTQLPISNSDIEQKLIEPQHLEITEPINDGCFKTPMIETKISEKPGQPQTPESTQLPISNSDIEQKLIEPQHLEITEPIDDGCFKTPMIETKISEKPTQPQTTESTQLPISNSDIAQKLIEPPQLERTEPINDGCFKTPMIETKISEKPTQPQTPESTQLPISNSDIEQKLIEPQHLEITEPINDGCFKIPMIETKISEKPTQSQTNESTQPSMSSSDIAQKIIEPQQLEITEPINDGCFKTPLIETKISENPAQSQKNESTQPSMSSSDIAQKLIEPPQLEKTKLTDDGCFKTPRFGSSKHKANKSKHKYVCEPVGPLKFKFVSSKYNEITPYEPTLHSREQLKELSSSDATGHYEEGKELSSPDATGHYEEGKELSFSDATGYYEEGKDLSSSDDTGYNEEENELPSSDSTKHSEEREELLSCDSENNAYVSDDLSCGFSACPRPISYTPVRPPEEGYAEPNRNIKSPFYSYCYAPINVIPMGDTYE